MILATTKKCLVHRLIRRFAVSTNIERLQHFICKTVGCGYQAPDDTVLHLQQHRVRLLSKMA
jgi:hypothetical protein